MPAPKPIPEPIAKKPPSKELQAMYGPIIDKAIVGILTQSSRTANLSNPARMQFKHHKNHKFPEGWPIGRIVKKEGDVLTRDISCDKIVMFGYLYRYTKWHTRLIMASRAGAMIGLDWIEKELDVSEF